MSYVNTQTKQYPLSEADIKSLPQYAQTGFGNPFTAPDIYAWVFPSPQPAHDPITQCTREIDPVLTDKGHYEQVWEVLALDPEQIAANQAAKAAQEREAAKQVRTATVAAINVTTAAGNTFDGDEVSQGRMARGILGLQAAGAETILWVLANNESIQVTVAELGEALALAGSAQAAAWVIE